MATVAQKVGEWLLGLLQGAAGSVFGGVTAAILFLYVFISLLVNREGVLTLIRQLNPLGEDVTDLYMAKMGAMVQGTVMGQFVIAVCQGVAGAASIYIAGFHQGFFLFAVLLSALSVIPLGSGIVTIPFGIGMILFGNVFGGVFVIALPLDRGDEHRQLPAADTGAAGGPPRLGADVARRLRGYRNVRRLGHRDRPGADDRHRHHHQRLPRGVQGRADGITGGRRKAKAAQASRTGSPFAPARTSRPQPRSSQTLA